jgi:D-alanyl-D-alanine endopeptidase (penicillin-binding protein 7)
MFALVLIGFGPAVGAESTDNSARPAASTDRAAPGKRVTVTYTKNGATLVSGEPSATAVAASKAKPTSNAAGNGPDIKSSAAMVFDVNAGRALYTKNIDQLSSIASITKLMTAIVVLDTGLPLGESIRIERADIDTLKHTRSRLRIGSSFTRRDLLNLALMSSENRAASALGRAYPGGLTAFVAKMNARAAELGMVKTRFVEPTGLSSKNVSTAEELALLVRASLDYPLIREFTTTRNAQVYTTDSKRAHGFGNSNRLVSSSAWRINVSKTGYISESGLCLVMHARITDRPVIIVLLNSWGKYTRIGDANRIKKWMERGMASLARAN